MNESDAVRLFSDVAYREAEAVEAAALAANAPEAARLAHGGKMLAIDLPHAPPVNMMTPADMAGTGTGIAQVAAETARAAAEAASRLPSVPVDTARLMALAEEAEEASATISEENLDATLASALAIVTDTLTAARVALRTIAKAGGLPSDPEPPTEPVVEKRRRWWRRSRV